MARLTAVLVGTLCTLVAAYAFLSPSFGSIINWLGPNSGPSLSFCLGLALLLFGAPAVYITVAITWAVIGIVVGLLVRRWRGSFGAAAMVYCLTFVLFVLTGLLTISRLAPTSAFDSSPSLSSFSFPPPPPGVNGATLLNEPLLKTFPSLLVSLTSEANPGGAAISGGSSYLLAGVENFVIFLIAALVAGLGAQKFLETIRPSRSGGFFKGGSTGRKLGRNVLKVLILIVFISPIATVPFGPHIPVPSSPQAVDGASKPSFGLDTSDLRGTLPTSSGAMETEDSVDDTSSSSNAITLIPAPADSPAPCNVLPCSLTFNVDNQQTPEGMSSVYEAGDLLYTANLFNLEDSCSQSGSCANEGVTMGLNESGQLTTDVSFTQATLKNGNGVIGYPNVSYGLGVQNQSPSLQLPCSGSTPATIGNFPEVVSMSSYSVEQSQSAIARTPYDFAYDIWATPADCDESASNLAFTQSSIELMIWLDNQTLKAEYGNGAFIKSANIPTVVDGIVEERAWSVYVNNGDLNNDCVNQPDTCHTSVYIVLHDPVSSGTVGVDLEQMFDEVSQVLSSNYADSWSSSTVDGYYVDQIDLGSEFCPIAGPLESLIGVHCGSQASASYSWTLSSYCYLLDDSLNVGGTAPTCPGQSAAYPSDQVVGVENTITVSGINISNSTACPSELLVVSLSSCFTVQQNFYVVPHDNIGPVPSDWVQNVLILGVDSKGDYWAGSLYSIFTSNELLACSGGISMLSSDCNFSYSFTQVSLPATFNVTSVIQDGGMTLITKVGSQSLNTYTYPGTLACLTSCLEVPPGSYMYLGPAGYPELDFVGPPTVSGGPSGDTAFGQGSAMSETASVKLVERSWSDSIDQSLTYANQPEEGSSGLSWACSGVNSGMISYSSSAPSLGVGFVPAPPGQPSVSCISPDSGTGYGGTSATIYGTDLSGATAVNFGQDNPASGLTASGAEITLSTPDGSGTVDVTVTTPAGTSSTTLGDLFTPGYQFTYDSVTSVSPVSGPESGGTLVTFTGSGFTSPMSVWFGSTASDEVTVTSSTSMTALTPQGTGSVTVAVEIGTVEIPVSGSITFTYLAITLPAGYLEAVLGEVDSDGSATNLYLFLNNSASMQSPALFGSSQASGVDFLVVFSESGGLTLLPSVDANIVSRYANLIPPTLLFMGDSGSCPQSQADAGPVVTSVTSSLGLSDLALLAAVPMFPDTTSSSNQVCLRVYQSDAPLNTVGPAIADNVLPLIHRSGLIESLENGLDSGVLIPGANAGRVNATMLVAGYANDTFFGTFVSDLFGLNQNQIATASGVFAFAGALTVKMGVVHSSSDVHTVNLEQLLGYDGSLTFASGAYFSELGVGAPLNGSSSTPSANDDVIPNDRLTVVTSTTSEGQFALLPGDVVGFSQVPAGKTLSPSTLQVTFTGIYPAELQLSKSFIQSSNGDVVVKVVVKNLDSSQISVSSMNDAAFLTSYKSGAALVSGNPDNNSEFTLLPGQSVHYSYEVTLNGYGEYVSQPAEITYTLQGVQFRGESNSVVWMRSSPNVFAAVVNLFDSLTTVALRGTAYASMSSTILAVMVLVLCGLAAFMELRAYRRWAKGD